MSDPNELDFWQVRTVQESFLMPHFPLPSLSREVISAFRRYMRAATDRLSVLLCNRHTANPARIGRSAHDCALSSLFWAVPALSETDIIDAFSVATDTWPYGGVTNKEFAVALSHLGIEAAYSTEINTLGALLATRPARCVALLRGHFIAIVDGAVAGYDARCSWPRDTRVYCHWTFTRQWFPRARNSRHRRAGSA